MRRREFYWSLYQKQSRRQIDDLRSDQVEAVFEVLSDVQKNDWLIWREGFSEWKEFTRFPDLLANLRRVHEEVAAQHPEPPDLDRASSHDVDTESDVELEFADDANTRDRDRRYPRKCDIIIVAGDKQIKNQTVNISTRGIELRDVLPEGLPNFFNVKLNLPGKSMQVVCSVLRSRDGAPSRRLRIEVNHNPNAFLSAILAT